MSVPDELRRYVPRTDLYDSYDLIHYHMPIEQPPSTASYIIFKKGNKIYAKNGVYGHIEFEGTDAATVIQSAIDALPTQGGKILIKSGEYPISSTIVCKSNLTIEGEGLSTVLKLTSDAASLGIFQVAYNLQDVQIKNLMLDGNNVNVSRLIFIRKVQGVTLQNIMFKNAYEMSVQVFCGVGEDDSPPRNIAVQGCFFEDKGIIISGGERVEISNCVFTNVTKYYGCIHITSTNHQAKLITIASNVFYDNERFGVGVYGNSSDISILNNVFYDTPTNYSDTGAIHISCESDGMKNIAVIGNTITWSSNPSATANGIVVAQQTSTEFTLENVAVIGNTIDGQNFTNTNTGIYLHGYSSAGQVRSVTVMGNTIRNMGRTGITITYSSRVTVSGNTIKDCGKNTSAPAEDRAGIRLASSNNIEVYGNIAVDEQATPTQQYGIIETGGSDNNRIYNNQLSGNAITQISTVGANTEVFKNKGFVTENSGTATISAGSTSVTVNHGLAGTPTTIIVTPSGDIGDVWVGSVTSTSFTIYCETAPSSDTTVYWYAEYKS